MPKPFHDARLKIERAKHHINDLDRRMRKFADADDAYSIYVEHDAKAGCDVIKVIAMKAVPEEFALIIGDALHNLRTALDFAMNDIVSKGTKYTKFPVYETRNTLEGAVNGGLKHNAPEHIIKFIVDTVQPYKGGDGDAIWSLHGLDIEDKHRLLIPRVHVTAVAGIRAQSDTGEKFELAPWGYGQSAHLLLPLYRTYKYQDHK